MMKKLLLWIVCFALSLSAYGVDLKPGDSEDRVLKALGFPDGSIDLKDGTLWLFEQGKVLMVDGRVARLDLLSGEEQSLNAQDRKRSKKAYAAFEANRERRIKEGLTLRQKQLANPGFLSQSAQSQLRYWKGFQQSYPGVDVAGIIRGLNQEVMTARQERERLARPRIVRVQPTRVWCQWHGYSCGTSSVSHRCSVRYRSTTTAKPGVTEFEDATFFVPPITQLPSGPVRSAARVPAPRK